MDIATFLWFYLQYFFFKISLHIAKEWTNISQIRLLIFVSGNTQMCAAKIVVILQNHMS